MGHTGNKRGHRKYLFSVNVTLRMHLLLRWSFITAVHGLLSIHYPIEISTAILSYSCNALVRRHRTILCTEARIASKGQAVLHPEPHPHNQVNKQQLPVARGLKRCTHFSASLIVHDHSTCVQWRHLDRECIQINLWPPGRYVRVQSTYVARPLSSQSYVASIFLAVPKLIHSFLTTSIWEVMFWLLNGCLRGRSRDAITYYHPHGRTVTA